MTSLAFNNTPALAPYLQLLGTLYLLQDARLRGGFIAIEFDYEAPRHAPIFNAIAPFDHANAEVYDCVCDMLRMWGLWGESNAVMQRYMQAMWRAPAIRPAQRPLLESAWLTLMAAIELGTPWACCEHGRLAIPVEFRPERQALADWLEAQAQHYWQQRKGTATVSRMPEPPVAIADAALCGRHRLRPYLQLIGAMYAMRQIYRQRGWLPIKDMINPPQSAPLFALLGRFDAANAPAYQLICDTLGQHEPTQQAPTWERYLAEWLARHPLTPRQAKLCECARLILQTALEDHSPWVCVELGRLAIPAAIRPSAQALEYWTKTQVDWRLLLPPWPENMATTATDTPPSDSCDDGITQEEVDALLRGVTGAEDDPLAEE